MLLYDFIKSKPEFKDCTVMELCDDGYSGTNFGRPAMKKLLERVKKKAVDCIIVKDLSRFGRDYLTVSDFVEQIFPFLGVRFISVNDGYDSLEYEGTTGGIAIAFRNVIYAWYSKDISEKEKSGKLRCGVCAYALIRQKKKNPSYRCETWKRTQSFDCMRGTLAEEDIKEAVWQAIQLYCKVLLEKQSLNKAQPVEKSEENIRTQISAYQSAVRGLDEQKAIAYERFLDGNFSKDQYIHKKNTVSRQQEEM